MKKASLLLLSAGLAGFMLAGCDQPQQTAQAVYAPPESSPDGVLAGATTPGLAGHESWAARSGLNSNPDNPSGMPGPSVSASSRY